EYSKALLNSTIHAIYLRRTDAGYNIRSIDSTIASATAIRADYKAQGSLWQHAVPANVKQFLMQNAAGYDEQLLWQLICYRLRILDAPAIAQYCQCSEGMENLLKQAVNCTSLAEALAAISQKRYPASRLRRTMLQLLLNRPRCCYEQTQPAYIRVLAFNDVGRQLLKECKAKAALPIITKLGKNPAQG
ncbi:protein containing DUF795, partial [gut metagenome]